MTQKEVDVLFNITIVLHENEFFGLRKSPLDRNEVQKWVAQKLTEIDIYTLPIGMSWGVIVTKEYWEEHHK